MCPFKLLGICTVFNYSYHSVSFKGWGSHEDNPLSAVCFPCPLLLSSIPLPFPCSHVSPAFHLHFPQQHPFPVGFITTPTSTPSVAEISSEVNSRLHSQGISPTVWHCRVLKRTLWCQEEHRGEVTPLPCSHRRQVKLQLPISWNRCLCSQPSCWELLCSSQAGSPWVRAVGGWQCSSGLGADGAAPGAAYHCPVTTARWLGLVNVIVSLPGM